MLNGDRKVANSTTTKKNRNRKQVQIQPPANLDNEWSDFESVPLATGRSTSFSASTSASAISQLPHLTQEDSDTNEGSDRTRKNASTSSLSSLSSVNHISSSSSSSRHLGLLGSTSTSTSKPQSSYSTYAQIPKQMAIAAMSIISPRSGNYDRLEGGMGPSRMGVPQNQQGWRRFGWKKFAIGAALLIGVVWLWGPRERRFDWKKGVSEIKTGLGGGRILDVPLPPHKEDDHDSSHVDQTNHPSLSIPKGPLTYESDPDPLKTLSCTTPHDPSAHIVQYALMIDAGSTGSRIHIYKFNNCGASPSYEYEVFNQTHPGLSSYAGRPYDAAKSLDILLDEAVRVIPPALHSCTPVAVKATAGLRLLEGTQSEDILEKVEERIKERYQFQLPDKDGVVIMDGKDEGVYAWITVNYLLGTITPGSAPAAKGSVDTYAVLDLGGASTQIVFEPSFAARGRTLEDGEHKYDLDFGGRKYELYQHSYLGYGLMKARTHVHRLVDFMASIRPGALSKFHAIDQDGDGEPDMEVVANPCLARGTFRTVEVADEVVEEKKHNVTMAGMQVGSFEACDRVVQLVIAKDAICEVKPCSFNGVYQPSLLDSFKNGKVLLLSYFYDRVAPLLPPGTSFSPSPASKASSSSKHQPPLAVSTVASLAHTVCLGPTAWQKIPHWVASKELMADLAGRPEWCLDLTFMYALLRLGYEFEDDRGVEIGKKIEGTELGWCLGAAIAMVGGELRCKA